MKIQLALILSLAATSAFASQEWKYRCKQTLLNGYQWVYEGSVPHSEAQTAAYVCYGYSGISNYCTEVRSGGVLGPAVPCNLAHLLRTAYTWNK